MPVYEYLCPKCGTPFELRRLFSEADKPALCPKCNAKAEKLISNFASKTGSYLQSPSAPFRKKARRSGQTRPAVQRRA